MKSRVLLLIISLSLMSGSVCYANANKTMDKIMNSWNGYPIDKLISVWGIPDEEKNIADRRLFYWRRSRQVFIPQTSYTSGNSNAYANGYGNYAYGRGNYNATTTTTGGYNVTYYCNIAVGVDDNKNINHMQWEGNACARTYKQGQRWINPENDLFAQEAAQKAADKAAKKVLKEQQKTEKKQKSK